MRRCVFHLIAGCIESAERSPKGRLPKVSTYLVTYLVWLGEIKRGIYRVARSCARADLQELNSATNIFSHPKFLEFQIHFPIVFKCAVRLAFGLLDSL